MTTGALIAAAGKSAEIEEFRPMMELNGSTLIQREIDTLRRVGISPIVVITGWGAEELETHLAHRGVVCLRNEQFAVSQMLDSVKIGLAYLKSRCDRVVFLPADAPLVSVDSITKVLHAESDFAVPVFGKKKGHPILISARIFDDILSYDGDNGLRGIMNDGGHSIEYVPVDDRGILMEVSDEKTYREILDYHQEVIRENALRCRSDLRMGKENWFFSPETAEFLERVDTEGSMLGACKQMSMSYSHGWKMIKEAEECMGFAFLHKKAGGSSGGNSTLTPEGRHFLECYRTMKDSMEKYADRLFREVFREYVLESDE